MQRTQWLKLALGLFLAYLALWPGSTITVMLDQVPAWGLWMGTLLLLLQGGAIVAWMLGTYGRRGALATLAAFLLAWAVEHIGETTGFPFGRYMYTDMLQPKLFGVTPFPITFAWLMVAIGSWQLARLTRQAMPALARIPAADILLAATLVMTIDLQIETVATFINNYWVWIDSGPFYGVPMVNFIAWWVVGLIICGVVTLIIGRDAPTLRAFPVWGRMPWPVRAERLTRLIPTLLYVLSSAMFMFVNFGRGYPLAGVVGIVFLGIVALIATSGWQYLRAESGRSPQTAD